MSLNADLVKEISATCFQEAIYLIVAWRCCEKAILS
jgi:hypothetical protein